MNIRAYVRAALLSSAGLLSAAAVTVAVPQVAHADHDEHEEHEHHEHWRGRGGYYHGNGYYHHGYYGYRRPYGYGYGYGRPYGYYRGGGPVYVQPQPYVVRPAPRVIITPGHHHRW